MRNKAAILRDLFIFLKKRKLWWLIPILVIFFIFGLLLLFAGSTPLAPLIYPFY